MFRRSLSLAGMLALAGCTADTFTGPDPLPPDAAPETAAATEAGDASPAPDGLTVKTDGALEAAAAPDDAHAPDACGGVGDLGTCAHSLCTIGVALSSGCDPQGLVANICPYHPECCASSWTQGCIDLALGQQAFACTGCSS